MVYTGRISRSMRGLHTEHGSRQNATGPSESRRTRQPESASLGQFAPARRFVLPPPSSAKARATATTAGPRRHESDGAPAAPQSPLAVRKVAGDTLTRHSHHDDHDPVNGGPFTADAGMSAFAVRSKAECDEIDDGDDDEDGLGHPEDELSDSRYAAVDTGLDDDKEKAFDDAQDCVPESSPAGPAHRPSASPSADMGLGRGCGRAGNSIQEWRQQVSDSGRKTVLPGSGRGMPDAIEDSESEQELGAMLLDSIEGDDGDDCGDIARAHLPDSPAALRARAPPTGSAIYARAQHKRPHPPSSSTPPGSLSEVGTGRRRRRTRLAVNATSTRDVGIAEPIGISSSSSLEEVLGTDADGDFDSDLPPAGNDASPDAMPPPSSPLPCPTPALPSSRPKRAIRRRIISSSPSSSTTNNGQDGPFNSSPPAPPPRQQSPPSLPSAAEQPQFRSNSGRRAPVLPQTPMKRPTAPRFQFTTPSNTPFRSQGFGTHTPVYQSLNAAVPSSTPQKPSSQLPASQFVLPAKHGGPRSRGDDEKAVPVIPLPEVFSPRKRGSKFVSGGLAETVRDAVLQAGGAMHVAATDDVRVQAVAPLGRNGALVASVASVEVIAEGDDKGGEHGPCSQRAVTKQDKSGSAVAQRTAGLGPTGGQSRTSTGQTAGAGSEPSGWKTGSGKTVLLVGADDEVARLTCPGDVVKIKHGWDLPVFQLEGVDEADGDSALAEGRGVVSVCWGPIR